MGLVWNRRKRIGRGRSLNMSTGGASISQRAGRVSVSSRGRGRVRVARGLSFRFKL